MRYIKLQDLYIDAPAPIADMFYMLQCIAPGMLSIVLPGELEVGDYVADDIDDYSECETVRALPQKTWVDEHEETLVHVLGGEERFAALAAAAESVTIKHIVNIRESSSPDSYQGYQDLSDDDGWERRSWDRRSSSPQDFTACSLEDCGYCGHCMY